MKVKSIIELRKIFGARRAEVYSVSLALKIIKFIKATETDAQFYSERMRRIAESCLQKDCDGKYVSAPGGYRIEAGKENEYFSSVSELDEAETEADISFSLSEAEEMKLTLEELRIISEFIDEGGGQ